jgi:hypothetical protein
MGIALTPFIGITLSHTESSQFDRFDKKHSRRSRNLPADRTAEPAVRRQEKMQHPQR